MNNEVGLHRRPAPAALKLLKEETKPPRKLGENDYYVVLYQLSRIPEEKIKPVFDDIQWRFLKRQLDQGRGMGMFLKQNGFIPDEAGPRRRNRPQALKVERKGRTEKRK